MIDVEAAAALSKFAKEIEKRTLPLGKWPDKVTPLEKRNRDIAWRMVAKLITFLEHAKESDMYLKLYEMAEERGNEKEMHRCAAIVKQEDRGYNRALAEMQTVLKEALVVEKKDPKAIKYGKELAEAKAARAAHRQKEEEERRVRRNAAARAKRAEAKAAAAAALNDAAKKSKTAGVKKATVKAKLPG